MNDAQYLLRRENNKYIILDEIKHFSYQEKYEFMKSLTILNSIEENVELFEITNTIIYEIEPIVLELIKSQSSIFNSIDSVKMCDIKEIRNETKDILQIYKFGQWYATDERKKNITSLNKFVNQLDMYIDTSKARKPVDPNKFMELLNKNT